MRKTDIDPNDIALISHLYWTQKTKVRVGKDLSDEVDIKKGVRQGCVLSPSLFNLYTEYIFREIDDVLNLKVNGENLNNLRYADDTVLLAESENDLQNLVTIIEEKSEQYGLMMNTKKTKVMVRSKTELPKVNIKVKGKCIEQIEQFKYLGQLITTDARSDDEIKRRITITKSAFTKLSHILTSKRVGLLTRLRVMKCFVWSPFLYASEIWTLNKNTEKRIEAMKMWIYRRMQRISWKEKVTNKKVLESVGLQRPELLLTIQRRKMKYYGPLRRHDSMQKRILEGKIDGRRGRGRRRQTWLGNIQETSQMKMCEVCETALDRRRWRTVTAHLGDGMAPS
ncbi:endonuclease-reverse transcriptase [Elysia marginata]|uniref:Endonuclease-reverse transcriptase n=1 Tax=Elysia marginata TaxID=1093978 RepID=A0AAV4JVX7_9GAST|nr:endonuclease-reverse transcriptase [Elysia marginata]